jgi:hypothetical protein
MKINKNYIEFSAKEVEELIIKSLYETQGISGITNIKFKNTRTFRPSENPQQSDYVYEFDGIEIMVE